MSNAPPTRTPKTYRPRVDVARRFSLRTRTAVLLHPRRATVRDPFASKMGGKFAWPRSERWPKCSTHGVPYVPVLQLRAQDVSELQFAPDKDLFQLLWCPEQHEDAQYGPRIATRWRHSQHGVRPLRVAEVVGAYAYYDKDCVPKECALHPERVKETAPLPRDTPVETIDAWLRDNAQADFDAMRVPDCYRDDAYVSMFAAAPTSKVGGFASYVMEEDAEVPRCACGRTMTLLVTVASYDCGDFCSGHRWAPSDVHRDAEGRRVMSSVKGSGLMLGHCGSLYVFICRRCEALPTATVLM